MRSDIAKLTTEKERRGGNAETKKYGGKVRIVHNDEHDYEDEFGGFHSSARKRAYGYDCKEFSDVLGPLRGALRKNLGRPWDKVYSEFCKFLDRRSVSGIHIFGHLCGRGGEVTVKGLYVGEDGKVWEHRAGYGGDRHVDDYYVHPVTGILCYREPSYRRHQNWTARAEIRALRENKVKFDGHYYEMVNGCWFEVWTAKNPYFGINGNLDYTILRKRSLNKIEIQIVKQYIVDRINELEVE